MHVTGRFLLVAVLLFAMCGAGAAEPKRVLLLHSYGRDFSPWSEIARGFRAELERQSRELIEFHDAALATERFGASRDEGPFVDYLQALFDKRRLDLIVAIGAPAARFVQVRRHQLFPETPMLFTGVDQRRVSLSGLTANDAVVANWSDFGAIMKNILQALPETTGIAVVVGNSPVERYWFEQIRDAVQPLTNQVAITWFNTLSLDEILKRAAALPPKSAIFYFQLAVDAAGVSHEQGKALSSLLAVANAPIFTHHDAKFGEGIVGGPLLSVNDVARQAAGVAVRVLDGEAAGGIWTPRIEHGTPKFDWRELQRWNISETQLPPGSKIYFREPSALQKYQMEIMAIVAAILFQTGLITWLIYEHRRRHIAELTTRGAMSELTQMNRIAGAGQLSASIAHEVNQPLAAISVNAGAALNWLKARTPNIDEARAALTMIKDDSLRAGDIVSNLRAMFKKDGQQNGPTEVNKVILSVLKLVRIELQEQDIKVRTQLDDGLPTVTSNEIQLQQVVLNLIMNAKHAMQSVSSHRELFVRSEQSEPGWVQVSIEDSGPGISPPDLERIFQPMFTTKSQGMGMGLSICRSIMETHGGRIQVVSGSQTGAAFQLSLQASKTKGSCQ